MQIQKRKIIPIVFSIFFLMGIIPIILAEECYQEFANVSTLCGGLDTGTYLYEGGWATAYEHTPEKIFDGNWNTGDYPDDTPTNPAKLFINYTIPNNVVGITWQIKTSNLSDYPNGSYLNITIPENCINGDTLILKISSITLNTYFDFYCYNGTEYQFLQNQTYFANIIFYEEAIIWELTEQEQQVSSLEQNVIYTTLREAGAGLGKFTELVGEGVPPLMFALAMVTIAVAVIWGMKSFLIDLATP